jgi:hypothetical protein
MPISSMYVNATILKLGTKYSLFLREGGGSHGWLKYFLLKILERYFLPKILKRYFLPKYLRDPFLSGYDERSSPWWLSLQILYNEGFPWRKGREEFRDTKLMIS